MTPPVEPSRAPAAKLSAAAMAALLGVALAAGTAACSASSPDRPSGATTVRPTGAGDRIVESEVIVASGSRTFSARVAQPRVGTAYPVVVFGHGFLQPPDNYATIIEALAARGYVVIAPESATEPLPSHAGLAADLIACAEWARTHVPAASGGGEGQGLVGHSMGGGAALLAAQDHARFTAIATLAAAETRPSAVAAAGRLRVPVLFVVGSQDTLVPPGVTRTMYAVSPRESRWVAIAGGSHCGFVDEASWGGFGCDSGTLPRSRQLELTAQLVGDWLDVRLKGRPPQPAPPGVSVDER